MRQFLQVTSVAVGMLGFSGCGSTEAPPVVRTEASPSPHAALPVTLPVPAPAPSTKPLPQEEGAEFADDADLPQRTSSSLFMPPPVAAVPALPPVNKPLAEKPAPRPADPISPPSVTLVGFIEKDGLQAIVSIEGETRICALGDTFRGLEVIKVEPPCCHFRFGERELLVDLFDQPLRHRAAPSIGSAPRQPNLPLGRSAPGIGPDPWARVRSHATDADVKSAEPEGHAPVPIASPPPPPTLPPLPGIPVVPQE